jgi:hypothetical protein
MKNDASTTSVEDRMRAAMALHLQENPAIAPSISKLCKQAGVNRSSLYQHHKPIIEEIHSYSKKKTPKQECLNKEAPRIQKDLALRNKALLYICLELHAELMAHKAREAHPAKIKPQKKRDYPAAKISPE